MKRADVWLKPGCTTCRAAVADLERRGVELVRHDLARERPPEEILMSVVDEHHLDRFLNPRGRTFKARGIAMEGMTLSRAIELVHEEPNLMKRPLVVAGGRGVFGFDRAAYEEMFGK